MVDSITELPFQLFLWVKSWSWKTWSKLGIVATFFLSVILGLIFYKKEFLSYIEVNNLKKIKNLSLHYIGQKIQESKEF